MPKIDLLFLAFERPEFTVASMDALMANTNWDLVNQFWVYTDGGRPNWMYAYCKQFALDIKLKLDTSRWIPDKFRSPVAIMNDYLDRSNADIFCKLDNDVIVPPGWLDVGSRLMEICPKVDALGIEAHLRPPTDCHTCNSPMPDGSRFCVYCKKMLSMPEFLQICPVPHAIKYARHIGGIGFIRRKIFDHARPVPRGRYGWTEFQWEHPEFLKAWIDPPLRVFLLDHLPFEPWRTLSREYVRKGWQRESWGEYTPEWSGLWEWWNSDAAVRSFKKAEWEILREAQRNYGGPLEPFEEWLQKGGKG